MKYVFHRDDCGYGVVGVLMKRYFSYKFTLLPNRDQKLYFSTCFDGVRFIYNKMLEERIALYEKYGSDKDELKLHKPKTYSQLKLEHPWLYDVDNQALANAQLQLRTAYANFFRSPRVGFPKFRSKKSGKRAFTTNNNKTNNLKVVGGLVHLPKIGWVKINQHRPILESRQIKAATIALTPTGKYTISILTEYEWDPPKVELPKASALGLDYSNSHFYVDSQGIKADMPHFYREAESRLAREQRKLSLMKRGSANYQRQRKKVAQCHENVANCRKDWLHKQSKRLAEQWDYICVEDINLQDMAGSRKFGKATNDNGFGGFRLLLAYKMRDRGKILVKIDKWFPSSKTCSICGAVNQNLTLKDREWLCTCGANHDRDINAAINIRNFGIGMVP